MIGPDCRPGDESCCAGEERSHNAGDGSASIAAPLTRRGFIRVAVAGAGASTFASRSAAAAALGVREEHIMAIPADKGLTAAGVAELIDRGSPTRYSGNDLSYLGMPVGGGCCGQLYLGGDGQLWHWDILNEPMIASSDATYAKPPTQSSPFRQGFAIRTRSGQSVVTRRLNREGFGQISFVGQYPIGTVSYQSPEVPVTVTLDAFSPFVPLEAPASTLPVTVLDYTVRNTSASAVTAELLGWSENPVCLRTRTMRPVTLHSGAFAGAGARGLEFRATDAAPAAEGLPADIVFEDWERSTFEGWTVTGEAFGAGPVTVAKAPGYMKRFGGMHASGSRFVTSHHFRAGGNAAAADGYTGKLTSAPFDIPRRYLTVRVGGGNHPGKTCVNVVVDGTVVASVNGKDSERMLSHVLDLRPWLGRPAVIEIVDTHAGTWGHVNADRITFGDAPADMPAFNQHTDVGTLALAVVAPTATVRPSVAAWASVDELFDAPAAADAVDAAKSQAGTVSVSLTLAPEESRTVRFLIGWHFPVPDRDFIGFLTGAATLRRHYATRFTSAQDVVCTTAPDLTRLVDATRTWVRTWYTDSTLPHWLLERTLAPVSTLATNTCYRFDNGRFYAWEGVGCCAGTCEHVWNYAQSIGRLFPALERDTRERVDLGIGFQSSTGEMGNRAEADRHWATDGQCGTILRIYREHQMSPDRAFLDRVWPRVKQAMTFVIGQDGGAGDGVLSGPQPNTLDTTWYGEVAWITGMYVAALRAAEAMATEVGDTTFAGRCAALARSGTEFLESTLWNGEYFIHRVDRAHANIINSNKGCHIDQLLGQGLAGQLGLPRVLAPDKSAKALGSVFKYNFSPDPAQYRVDHPEISGGRWFAMADEPGLIMTTWPHGGADTAPGKPASWAAMYFNEVWSGQEYAVADQLIAHGLVAEGLSVTRAVNDRYHAGKRNPYNEIECGDHYARAMSSHGVHLALCGFEYHGPKNHIGFAPRITPDKFAAAFTAAQGWGLYRQTRTGAGQTSTLDVRHGKMRLRTIALAPPTRPAEVAVTFNGAALALSGWTHESGRLVLSLAQPLIVTAGKQVQIAMST